MNLRKITLKYGIAIGLCLSALNSWSQVTTFGERDCGQWIASSAMTKPWVIGYLNGLNDALADPRRNFDPLGKLNSAEQAFLWMDNYCKANPLKKVSNGVRELFSELMK